MNIITYLKPVPVMKRVFGYSLILLGLVTFATGNWVFGLIFIVIGGNLVSTEGSQTDLTTKKIRTVKSVFGINFGTWKTFPDFEYVSVFKTKQKQAVRVVTASATFEGEVILLNLFYTGNKHITVYSTPDKQDAFKVAEHLRLALAIDVLDATESEKKWIEAV